MQHIEDLNKKSLDSQQKIYKSLRRLLQVKPFNVILWDERLSTVAANRVMLEGNMRRDFRKQHKDELAAVVILQNYLDFKK